MFWTVLYAICLTQGLFLITALLMQSSPNRQAQYYLIMLVGFFSLVALFQLVWNDLPPLAAVLLGSVLINGELLTGPLILLFIQSVLTPDIRLLPRAWPHFIPLLAGLVFWLALNLGAWLDLFALTAGTRRWMIGLFVVFKGAYLLAYLGHAHHRLKTGLAQRRFSLGRQLVHMHWLPGWLLGMMLMVAAIYVVFWLEYLGFAVPVNSDRAGIVVQTVFIYLVSLMVLVRPWILTATPKPDTRGEYAAEASRVLRYLEQHQPYLDPELQLGELAAALDMPDNRLSRIINEGLQTNYYQLLNQYRLAHFEALAKSDNNRHKSVLELAYASGFNSKASFYRLFRKTHRATPKAYLKSLHVKQA